MRNAHFGVLGGCRTMLGFIAARVFLEDALVFVPWRASPLRGQASRELAPCAGRVEVFKGLVQLKISGQWGISGRMPHRA